MKIGVLTHNYPRFRGDFSGRFVEALSEELVRQGHQVTILAPWDPAYARLPSDHHVDFELYRYAPRADWHRLGYMRSMRADVALRAVNYVLAPGLFLAGARAVLHWTERERPDVLHAHWAVPNGFLAALASRRYGIPLVVSIPGSDATVAAQNPVFGRLARFAFNQAGLITANSEALRDVAIGTLGADPARFDLIPYGVDPASLRSDPAGTADLRRQLGIPQDAVILLAVGRMVYKKGFDSLLRSAALLEAGNLKLEAGSWTLVVGDSNPEAGGSGEGNVSEAGATRRVPGSQPSKQPGTPQLPASSNQQPASSGQQAASSVEHPVSSNQHPASSLHLVFIGEGDLWETWQALGRELGLGERVHWVGNVPSDRIGTYYNMADVLVMPSVTQPADGLNVTVLDAMSCGKPVVGTRAAGNELAIEDGLNGYLVPEGDPAALAAALARLTADASLRQRMGECGRRRIDNELGWPQLAARYAEHYRNLAGRQRS